MVSNTFISFSIFILLQSFHCNIADCVYNWRSLNDGCGYGEVRVTDGSQKCIENTCLRNVYNGNEDCEKKCTCNNGFYRGFNNECVRLEDCVKSFDKHFESIEEYKKETPVRTTYKLKNPTAHTVHVLCYDDLGCFDKHRISDQLPSLPETIKATVTHYSKRKLFDGLPDNGTVRLYPSLPTFVPNQFISRIVILSHGFRSTGFKTFYLELKERLLQNPYIDLVLILDWGDSTNENYDLLSSYWQAATNTEMVGRQVGLILANWRNMSRITSHSIHLWGFSLGAHLLTAAANFYTANIHEKIRRISLMDAAGPGFDNIVLRPTKEVAQFVEAYHTSGGDDMEPLDTVGSRNYGINKTMGHIDYYINGGSANQPGCEWYYLPQCSHAAARAFFRTAIDCEVISIHCDSYINYMNNPEKHCSFTDTSNMGLKSETSIGRGSQFISTTNDESICDLTEEHKELLKRVKIQKSRYFRVRNNKLFS